MGIDTDVTASSGTPDVGRKVQAFGRGQHLFEEGESAEFFYKVVSGVIRTYRVQEDGRRHIDSFHVAGDFFGIETGLQYRFSANAVSDATVIALRRRRTGTLSALEPALAREVTQSVLRSLERAQNHSQVLGLRMACEKVTAFLSDMAVRLPRHEECLQLIPQTDIADHLGLSRETVSRALCHLGPDGRKMHRTRRRPPSATRTSGR